MRQSFLCNFASKLYACHRNKKNSSRSFNILCEIYTWQQLNDFAMPVVAATSKVRT